MVEGEGQGGEEGARVGEVGVCGWVVGHEEVDEEDRGELRHQAEVVDCAPGEVGDDQARGEAAEQDAEGDA